eukprot:c38749_g1_i1 orf=422-805(-)
MTNTIKSQVQVLMSARSRPNPVRNSKPSTASIKFPKSVFGNVRKARSGDSRKHKRKRRNTAVKRDYQKSPSVSAYRLMSSTHQTMPKVESEKDGLEVYDRQHSLPKTLSSLLPQGTTPSSSPSPSGN